LINALPAAEEAVLEPCASARSEGCLTFTLARNQASADKVPPF